MEPRPAEHNGTAPKAKVTGRPKTGTVEPEPLQDGSVSIRGRFSHQGERFRVVFGRDVEGWTEQRAGRELKNIYAQLDAGIPIEEILARYEPAPLPVLSEYRPGILYDVYASRWLERRRIGEIGPAPLADNTYDDYLSRLRNHILPFFGRIPVVQIADTECKAFRAKLFSDRDKLLQIVEAGGRTMDKHGRLRKPLSLRSIQMQLGLHAQILDEAIEDKIRPDNPARSKRLRVRVPKPDRTFLEIDQLVALLDAAGELEAAPMSNKRAKLTASQAEEIRARLAHGETQYALRLEFGMSSGSISMLANGKTYRGDNGRVGWRALCVMLGYAGPRISEALDLKEKDVRLHDPRASRLWIADSKTETGIRHVEVTHELRYVLLAHRAEKSRRGYPMEPDTPFFCTRKGTRWDDGNVRERVLDAAAKLASERLAANGLPPLPHVTPHTMRRTYISIMLLASKFDVKFVQSQVGHEDSKVTVDIYQQLLKRSQRGHSAAFDTLVSEAKSTLYGAQNGDFCPPFCPPSDFDVKPDICPAPKIGFAEPKIEDGDGEFRIVEGMRVKRALSH